MSFHQDIRRINLEFENGILPPELDFSIKKELEIDWEKVKYNSFYKSFEYAASKFPDGFENIPCFDKIIEASIPKKTPLQEILERQEIKIDTNDIHNV